MSDAVEAISSIKDLPTFPGIVAQINEMIEDPNTSAEDIKNVISKDISLSANVLKLVNSSFYGFSRRITSITHALVILGFNAVRNLALSAFMMEAFRGRGSRLDIKEFWLHSIGVGLGVKCVGEKIKIPQAHELFIFGLMHDVGRIIMAQFFPAEFDKVVAHVEKYDCLIRDAEIAVMGYDHAELGAALFDRWQLPLPMVRVVEFHHRPHELLDKDEVDKKTVKIARALELADVLTRALLIGNAGDRMIPFFRADTLGEYGLGKDDIANVMDSMQDEIRDARSFIEVVSN